MSSVYFWRETDGRPQLLQLIVDQAENPKQTLIYKPNVQAIAVSPSGRLIAVVGTRIPMQILDTQRERQTAKIGGIEQASLVALSDSNKIATVSNRSGDVNLWDTISGEKIAELGTHRSTPVALSFSRNGRYLASADIWSAKVWNVSEQKCIQTIEIRKGVSNTPRFSRVLAFLPDSKSIVVGVPWQVHQIDLATGDTVASFNVNYWEDNLWNLQPSTRKSWSSSDSETTLVSVSNEGDKVAAQFGDGRLYVWRMSDKTGIAATHVNSQALDMAFANNGEELVAGTMRFESFHISNETWQCLPSTSGAASPRLFAYSPHEHIVATCVAARSSHIEPKRLFADVKLWDVATGRKIARILPRHEVSAIGFVADSRVLALANSSAVYQRTDQSQRAGTQQHPDHRRRRQEAPRGFAEVQD